MTSAERLKILRGIEDRGKSIQKAHESTDAKEILQLVNHLILAELKDDQAKDLAKGDLKN